MYLKFPLYSVRIRMTMFLHFVFANLISLGERSDDKLIIS